MQAVFQLHMQMLNASCPDTLATLFTISVTENNFGVCEHQYLNFLENVQPKLVSCSSASWTVFQLIVYWTIWCIYDVEDLDVVCIMLPCSILPDCQVSEEHFASILKVGMLAICFFWDTTLRQSAFSYWLFETAFCPYLQGSRCPRRTCMKF